MKTNPDDPRWSAYLLDELSSEEAVELERALAAEPALRLSLRELERTVSRLDATLAPQRARRLLPSQRAAIRRELRGGTIAEMPRKRRWRAAAGVAALAACGVGLLYLQPWRGEPGGSVAPPQVFQAGGELPKLPLASGAEFDAGAVGLPDFSRAEALRLPVLIQRAPELAWSPRRLASEAALPEPERVLVECLIDATAVAPAEPAGGFEWELERIAHPWRERASLVRVELRGGAEPVDGLELNWNSSWPRRQLRSLAGVSWPEALPERLPAGHRTVLLLECEDGPGEPGAFELRRGGELERRPLPEVGAEPSVAMRRAALAAALGLWLRGEGVDAERLGELLEGWRPADPETALGRECGWVDRALELARAGR